MKIVIAVNIIFLELIDISHHYYATMRPIIVIYCKWQTDNSVEGSETGQWSSIANGKEQVNNFIDCKCGRVSFLEIKILSSDI